jgi:hypothetical protein
MEPSCHDQGEPQSERFSPRIGQFRVRGIAEDLAAIGVTDNQTMVGRPNFLGKARVGGKEERIAPTNVFRSL